MNPFSPRRRLSASRFSLGLMVLSACLGTTPQATTPAPASSPLVGVADTSDTSAGPIYVVDGNVVPPSALAAMNPDDEIGRASCRESVQVLDGGAPIVGDA